MYLPRAVYEALPYAYLAGGATLCVASYRSSAATWSDAALAAGVVGMVAGGVLLLRRRSSRLDATHYDGRSLEVPGPDARPADADAGEPAKPGTVGDDPAR